MHLIKLPELRLSDLQNLSEKCINICNSLKELETATQNINNTLTTFKDGISNENPSYLDKKTQDKTRDANIAGLFNQVAVEKAFPENSSQAKEQLTHLSLILNKYTKRIIQLPYSEESIAIDNLLNDIKSIDLALLHSSITRWIPLIEKENKRFKEISNEKKSNNNSLKLNYSAIKIAPYLINSLEGLFTLVFAYTQISNDDKFKNIYIQLNEIVDAYR